MCDESRVKRSFPPKFPPACWVCNTEFSPSDKACPGCGRDLQYKPEVPNYAEHNQRMAAGMVLANSCDYQRWS